MCSVIAHWQTKSIKLFGQRVDLRLPYFKLSKPEVSVEIMLSTLALLSVAMIIFEIIVESNLFDMTMIYVVDGVICAVFLGDWLVRMVKAKKRSAFLRKSWWELLAAVPVYIEPTGVLRFVRLVVRLRILFNKSKLFIKHAYPLEIFTFFAVIVFGSADLFYAFEHGVNGSVTSFFDAIWWAMVTVTTIGYGDITPVTVGGRVVSMVLMMLGIGFLGLTTGIVARWMVTNKQQPDLKGR